VLKGYRGFLRELARTGSFSSLALQVRTGVRHAVRRWLGGTGGDPVARFLENYAADGFRLPDAAQARLQLAAEACLVCGLCSLECARVGGTPRLDPRDAVVSAARLEIDWVRLGLAEPVATVCDACAACDAACPAGIPIQQIQTALATNRRIR
jgi:succinate dehydrogenase/fumarate reductase-like Fe-S protein